MVGAARMRCRHPPGSAAGRCAQARLQSPPVVAPDLLLRLGPDASPCSAFLLEPMMLLRAVLMWVSSGGGRRFVPMQLPVVANPPMSSGPPGFPQHIHGHGSMHVRRAALEPCTHSKRLTSEAARKRSLLLRVPARVLCQPYGQYGRAASVSQNRLSNSGAGACRILAQSAAQPQEKQERELTPGVAPSRQVAC